MASVGNNHQSWMTLLAAWRLSIYACNLRSALIPAVAAAVKLVMHDIAISSTDNTVMPAWLYFNASALSELVNI